MRLAVICYPTYGGSGVVATELSKQLAIRGHDVHMVSYERPFRFDPDLPNLHFHQVEVSDYPLFRYQPYELNLANKIIELVEGHGVELVHSHYAVPHAMAAWQAREVLREERGLDVALACTLHGTDITLIGRERSFYELTRFSIVRQDLLTAPSRWLAQESVEQFHIPPSKIRVIPNFVDLDRFYPDEAVEIRRELDAEGSFIITHMSNFRPVKRVEDVVRGFAVLRQQLPAVLLLVGDGPERPKAIQLAEELGVTEHVRVLGKRKQLAPILQASDLYLLPSVAESFGLSALEAQACGCPVIGYHAGGLPEVVADGETGILCPTGENVCLGSLAADLLADTERYTAMREASRRRAETFATRPIIDRYEQALGRLVNCGMVCV